MVWSSHFTCKVRSFKSSLITLEKITSKSLLLRLHLLAYLAYRLNNNIEGRSVIQIMMTIQCQAAARCFVLISWMSFMLLFIVVQISSLMTGLSPFCFYPQSWIPSSLTSARAPEINVVRLQPDGWWSLKSFKAGMSKLMCKEDQIYWKGQPFNQTVFELFNGHFIPMTYF